MASSAWASLNQPYHNTASTTSTTYQQPRSVFDTPAPGTPVPEYVTNPRSVMAPGYLDGGGIGLGGNYGAQIGGNMASAYTPSAGYTAASGALGSFADPTGATQKAQYESLYNQLLSQYQAASAPRNAAIDATNANLASRIGVYDASYQNLGGNAYEDYLYNMAMLGGDQRGIQRGIDAANRDNGFIDTIWNNDLNYGRFLQDMTGKNLNATQTDLKSQYELLRKQYGFNDRDYNLTADAARKQNTATKFGIGSDATGRGAATSLAAQLGFQGADDQLQNQLGRADLTYSQTRAGLDRNWSATDTAWTRANNDYSAAWQSAQHSIDNGYNRMLQDKASNSDRIAALNDQASMYGVKADHLYNMYQQGIEKLNLDRYMTVDKLLDMMSSNNLDKLALAEQIARSATEAASGLYSSGVTSIAGGLSGGLAPAGVAGGSGVNVTGPSSITSGSGGRRAY